MENNSQLMDYMHFIEFISWGDLDNGLLHYAVLHFATCFIAWHARVHPPCHATAIYNDLWAHSSRCYCCSHLVMKVLLRLKKPSKIQLYWGAHSELRSSWFCTLLSAFVVDTGEWKSHPASNVCCHITLKRYKKLRNSNWNAVLQ
jgi:hypothetical protein